jgi:hypothetical protein
MVLWVIIDGIKGIKDIKGALAYLGQAARAWPGQLQQRKR